MSDFPETRYHGKVRVQKGETLIEVNIFDDNKEKLYLEIQQAVAQFSSDIKPATAAQRDIARAEQAVAARKAAPPAPAPKPEPPPKGTRATNAPVCPECGLSDSVELVRWVDKDTGEQKKAWKCQLCKKWIRT
jgi:hypothetical protein